MKVIEWHLVAITTEDDEPAVIDDRGVAISCRGSSVFNLSIGILLRSLRLIVALRN